MAEVDSVAAETLVVVLKVQVDLETIIHRPIRVAEVEVKLDAATMSRHVSLSPFG